MVLAAPPDGCAREYTLLLDLALLEGATVVAAPADALPDAARRYGGTAAIVPAGAAVPGRAPGPPGHRGVLTGLVPASGRPSACACGAGLARLVSRITSSTHTSKTAATVKAADMPWMSSWWAALAWPTPGAAAAPRRGRRCRTR